MLMRQAFLNASLYVAMLECAGLEAVPTVEFLQDSAGLSSTRQAHSVRIFPLVFAELDIIVL
jgi:hypothetical protein